MSSPVPPAERLLDLVIALTHTPWRMTKAQIRSSVNGYAQAATDATFERMFSRDKDTLRELGIPLVTVHRDGHVDDIGYRIDREGYEMPPLELSPEQLGVLSVAAQVWQDATLDSRARRALVKLRAVASPDDPPSQPPDDAPLLRLPEPEQHLEELLVAATARGVVRFRYRAAHSGRTERREVEPWRLLVREGAWYLQAWDRTRAAERVFRLSRVAGGVERVPDADAGAERQEVGPPPARPTVGEAVLRVRPDRAGALRLRARSVTPGPDGDTLVLDASDLDEIAGLVAGYTDAVVVLAPSQLREAVVARLRAVASLGPS